MTKSLSLLVFCLLAGCRGAETSDLEQVDDELGAASCASSSCRACRGVGTACDAKHACCDGSSCRAGSCARCTGSCGDTAGAGATDVPCCCGDTVVTYTTLADDPVATAACRGDGLALAPGVRLDLGGRTVAGSGTGTGLAVPGGGAVSGGTVHGFDDGLRVTGAGATTVSSLTIDGNAGDGVEIDLRSANGGVKLETIVVSENGGDGIRVHAAPGASNLDDAAARVAVADYGLRVTGSSSVHDNAGLGVHLGEAAQPADVAALLEGVEVARNAAGGLLVEQDATLGPGADCGESAGQPGCSGATVTWSAFRDNGGAGVELRSGFILPRLATAGQADDGRGFVGNEIFHNATGTGCSGSASVPQIAVTGPVGLSSAACAAATTEQACEALLATNHCTWTPSACKAAWDLRGDADAACIEHEANLIYDYVIASPRALGLQATGGAVVNARHEIWRTGNATSDYFADSLSGSWVDADSICGTYAICSSP